MTLLLQGAGIQALTVAPSVPVPLLDLEADTLALNDGDPVALWADQSGNGNDFTQIGTARPTYRAGGGNPYVEFDGVDDWMLGDNWPVLDNLSSMTAFLIGNLRLTSSGYDVIAKINNDGNDPGWDIGDFSNILAQTDGDNYLVATKGPSQNSIDLYTVHLVTIEKLSNSEYSFRYDGGAPDVAVGSTGTITTLANSAPMTLATTYSNNAGYEGMELGALRIYAPALSSTDRAAVEAELAARYGITL